MEANQSSHQIESPLLLAVDRNPRNLELLKQFLDRSGFQTITAHSLEGLAQTLAETSQIQLALIDISGFDRQIWTYCEQLRSQQIPFLILLPKQSTAIQEEGLSHGAQGMLVKPLVTRELLALIRSFLEVQV
ncbi:response regulator [Merismopedia glauca]|uniref:Response regulator n=1 Tax=Merismopedia glauca CCAP 1448/3 TaxID=1296344 RepID=A0A2T1CAL7_9CYAN|nr:response regulator [Merismopedia glauca]PSB05302.1 response regulator [Merismopedia glauca CCAP 1448/3]